jgi:hypothetical protein
VVESLMREQTVLPSRFGTMLADDEALRATMAAHAVKLSAGLERLRGCVELGLRVLCRHEPMPPGSASSDIDHASGRAYMLARLEQERRRTGVDQEAVALFDQLHNELMQLARDGTRWTEGGTLSDDEIDRLGQTFMLLERRMKELKETFGLTDKDLNIDLGPLGKLL